MSVMEALLLARNSTWDALMIAMDNKKKAEDAFDEIFEWTDYRDDKRAPQVEKDMHEATAVVDELMVQMRACRDAVEACANAGN